MYTSYILSKLIVFALDVDAFKGLLSLENNILKRKPEVLKVKYYSVCNVEHHFTGM